MANKLIVTAAPHITSADSTQKIMQRVCLALVPTLAASVLIFGINALLLTVITVAACVGFEYGWCKLRGQEIPVGDFSAVVTGMLLAYNVPASIPLWVPIAISLLAVLLALYIVIWVLILCIGIVVLACAIVAAAGLLTLPFAIMESVTYFVMVMGCTLLGGGIALLLIPAFWFAARGTARLTGYCLRRIFVR